MRPITNKKQGNAADAEDVEDHVTRVIPQFKADFQTVLASNKSFLDGYTQTLEPRVQIFVSPL